MIDTANILQLKREMFHVNIRRQRNEQHFKNQRQICIKKMFENFEYLQEMSQKIREKIDNNQQLSGNELVQMVKRIFTELMKENNMNLLDTIDAAVWMIKSTDSMDYDENIAATYQMMQIVDKMLYFSQGYGGSEPFSQQIIIYAAKFLKYWILLEDPYFDKIYVDIAETTYFLINKQEPILVKKGTDILYNVITTDNGRSINDFFSLKIFDQKLVRPLCNLLLSNQSQKIQYNVWQCILETFQNGNSETIDQFLTFTSETERQCLTFFSLLTESALESEQKSLKYLKNQLNLILKVLNYCEVNDENKYKKYVQELKESTAFGSQLEHNWLFHKWNSITNSAHEIQVHLSG